MPSLLPHVDPEGLLEFSVVYTDRALNHMSHRFQQVMTDLSTTLKRVYAADAVAVIPGSGTFAMEAVARQYAAGRRCLVIRNGWFSYRWSQILEQGSIPAAVEVLKARPLDERPQSPFAPPPLDEVLAAVQRFKPELLFAPHVETSSGMWLPDPYVQALADGVHREGGLLVLDGIASGALWVDMRAQGVDLLLSAPQKGWSGSPCCGLVMLGERALMQLDRTTSSSFSCDLKRWLEIMRAYEQGGHAYHATMPTDGLCRLQQVMKESEAYGFDKLRDAQWALGRGVRALLAERGFASVAAPGFEAPGVVVCYTQDAALQNGSRFRDEGIQIAAGVPLACDEPEGFQTFRIGLFGLDKLYSVPRTVETLQRALERMG